MTELQNEFVPAAAGPDAVVDRATWRRLRRADYKGMLQPEGAELVNRLHDLHPDWSAES